MAIEQGIVVERGKEGSGSAWVETVVSPTCESCSSRGSCHGGSGNNRRKVEAINEVDAKVGDRIQLSLSSASMLKATFLLYLFPILCMLAGALAADVIAKRFQLHASFFTAGTAFIFLGLAMVIVRIKGNRLATKADYRPKIIRIIGHGSFQGNTLDDTMGRDRQKLHQA